MTHTYPGAATPAIRDLAFAVGEGEVFGFFGPSGAGKSTTQHILTVACGVRYRHAALSAHPFQVEGVTIPTASLEDLIATKQTGRLEDAANIILLEAIRRLKAG